MCGIAALVRTGGAPAQALAGGMIALAAHRGPDGQGVRAFGPGPGGVALAPQAGGPVALAHARLAVLDPSAAAAQPMADPSGRWWASYNGEIYNFASLRGELAARGHALRTACDTEVLLAAWAEWGPRCLARLDGIFAFVLLDARRGQLHAVRDRFGVKPLYWWQAPDGALALASEIKQFSALPGWRPRPQPQRAYDFLAWSLTDHTDATLFEGVRQLRGGHRLEVDLALGPTASGAARPAPRVVPWYTLAPDPAAAGLDAAAAAEGLRGLLRASVHRQLRADVPVGASLSGGLDSSSLVCLARERLRGLRTVSARSEAAAWDEGAYIHAVVAATGARGHEVLPGAEGLFELLPRLAWHQDEPFAGTSAYAQWQVFALARQAGLKVLLDGQGADEALGGYPGFFGPRLAGLLRAGRWRELAGELRVLHQGQAMPVAQSLARMADAVLPDALRQGLRRLARRPSHRAPWLDLRRLGALAEDPFARRGARAPSVQALSRAQLLATHLPMLLRHADRNAMAHGVEARVPFLDHRLVEFALGLADERKVGGGTTKRVLRDAMRGVLPEPVRLRRDKIGFATAEEAWVRARPAPFRALLARAIEQSGGVLRPLLLDEFDAMLAGRRPYARHWWRAISYGAWADRFGVGA